MTSLLLSFFLLFFAEAKAAPLTDENASWNINANRDGSNPANYYGSWPGHKYFPSPKDWRDVPVYQFITDRLRDGDPANNEGKYGGYNLYDVTARHGGDFRGIKDSLHYIKSLGFDGIWISPVFQNRFNSYHGYAQIDFTVLDERFGTLADFRELVDDAHKLGMYVIVDIVVNHMDNLLYFVPHREGGASFRLHDGEYHLDWRNPNDQYTDFKFDNTFDPNKAYCDVYGDDGNRQPDPGRGTYSKSDFHHNGDLGNYGDPWQNHLGKIYGAMDDLRTTSEQVQNKIIAMTKALISSVDIDGIRMDTPMQVPLCFFKKWTPEVKQHAKSLGKENFFVFGEFYCGRERAATMVGRGRSPHQWGTNSFIDGSYGMDAGINYRFYYDFVDVAIKQQKGGIENLMDVFLRDTKAYDLTNPFTGEFAYTMLNFINNHDQPRLNTAEDGFEKTRLGNAVIAFWPGIPLFYYGDEQAFSTYGSAVDGPAREDFMTSKAWYKMPSKSEANPANKDNFDMTSRDYLYVQKIMNIRRQYYALRNTDEVHQRWAQVNNSNGIYAFTRIWGEQKNWVLVAFNTWKERLEAGGSIGPFYTGWNKGDRIVNAMNPSERYTIGEEGKLDSLWVDGYETKVFVREDNLQPLAPVVQSISPAHDIVSSNSEIVLEFSEPMEVDSVKQALRFNGDRLDGAEVFNEDRSFRVRAKPAPGINKIVVETSAKAKNGKNLIARFQSRFRVGEETNPLIKLQSDFLSDGTLVTVKSGKMELFHKAKGAERFRFTTDQGKNWSPWHTYRDVTDHQAPHSKNFEIWVQYWADGSAAYFTSSKF